MRKILLFTMLTMMSALLAPTLAHAAVSPLSVNIFPPVQFPPEDFTVAGLRLSVVGEHHNLFGVDLGLIGNVTEQEFTGIGVSGVFNNTRGDTNVLGLQLAGVTNYNTGKTSVYGVQASAFNYQTAESKVVGVALGIVNWEPFTAIYGFQLGVYNRARSVHGLQIGLVNDCDNLHGIQIGLVNFNHQGPFVVSPILNVGF